MEQTTLFERRAPQPLRKSGRPQGLAKRAGLPPFCGA